MDDSGVATALVAWARATLPELVAGYDHAPDFKGALPDVVCEVDTSAIELGSTAFVYTSIEQRYVLVWRCTMSFMVDNSNPDTADSLLKSFADRLRASVLQDGTLGGRVPFVSLLMTFDYATPFIEYEDGTRGREMTLAISVGELVEAEQ